MSAAQAYLVATVEVLNDKIADFRRKVANGENLLGLHRWNELLEAAINEQVVLQLNLLLDAMARVAAGADYDLVAGIKCEIALYTDRCLRFSADTSQNGEDRVKAAAAANLVRHLGGVIERLS